MLQDAEKIIGDNFSDKQVEFAKFLALPRDFRPQSLKNQNQFSALHSVDITTLSRWKKLPNFQRLVRESMLSYHKEKLGEVLENLSKKALNSESISVEAIRLWLQFVEGWSPKGEKLQKQKKNSS